MKKIILLWVCLAGSTVLYAQDEKKQGDEMAASENYTGAAMMYRLCMEDDAQCALKLFRLIYDKKIESQSTDELYQLISPLAEQGNAEAQFYLGEMYVEGYGVEKDLKEAAGWYQKSVKQGNADARRSLDGMTAETTPPLPKAIKQKTRKNTVSAGINFGEYIYSVNKTEGYSTTPAFTLSYERRIKMLGLGGLAGYSYCKIGDDDTYSNIILGLRLSVHHHFLEEKLDVYGGVITGCWIVTNKWGDSVDKYYEPMLPVFIGAGYNFHQSFAVFAELGYTAFPAYNMNGFALLNIGLSFAF
jgi:hypothetical protein